MVSGPVLQALLLLGMTSALVASAYRVDKGFHPGWPSSVLRITAAAVIDGEIHAVERGGTDLFSTVVWVLDRTGRVLRTWGHGKIASAHGAKAAGRAGEIFITDDGDNTIKLFDSSSGAELARWGQTNVSGTGLHPLQFGNVADVAVVPGNTSVFYVVDGDGGPNNRLLALAWEKQEHLLWSSGDSIGSGKGEFHVPHSVAYDPTRDALWVADRSNNRTQTLRASDGSFLFEWPPSCFQPGTQPWGVRFDYKRRVLFVCDGTMGKLYVYEGLGAAGAEPPSCKPSQVLDIPPAASHLHEMAVDPDTGDVYIAQVGVPTGFLRVVRD